MNNEISSPLTDDLNEMRYLRRSSDAREAGSEEIPRRLVAKKSDLWQCHCLRCHGVYRESGWKTRKSSWFDDLCTEISVTGERDIMSSRAEFTGKWSHRVEVTNCRRTRQENSHRRSPSQVDKNTSL
jgi:hypothetical protein